jgi:hypothetical protein
MRHVLTYAVKIWFDTLHICHVPVLSQLKESIASVSGLQILQFIVPALQWQMYELQGWNRTALLNVLFSVLNATLV